MIRNIQTGHVYVGSGASVKKRARDHIRGLLAGNHRNDYFQNAFRKYGQDAFTFEVIETVPERVQLIMREQFYMNSLNACDRSRGYNIAPTAGSQLGFKRRPESNAATAAGLRGRKLTDERKAKNGEWWNSLTAEDKAAHLDKRREGLRRSHAARSSEVKAAVYAKISKALTGKPLSAEHAAKARAASFLGGKAAQAPAAKEKQREAIARYWATPGVKEKHGESIARGWATRRNNMQAGQ